MKIAIDGPAGAGKSTVARRLANRLGYLYVDTGAMYRALTHEVLQRGVDPRAADEVYNVSQTMDLRLQPGSKGGVNKVFVGERDITRHIRLPRISETVSLVASHEQVREAMVRWQRHLARLGNVVMDGRDIGTTVLPDADLKVFLQASVEERARRRSLELVRRGYQVDLSELVATIEERDRLDSSRVASPLRKASDAIEIDTTALSINQVVEHIRTILSRREANV